MEFKLQRFQRFYRLFAKRQGESYELPDLLIVPPTLVASKTTKRLPIPEVRQDRIMLQKPTILPRLLHSVQRTAPLVQRKTIRPFRVDCDTVYRILKGYAYGTVLLPTSQHALNIQTTSIVAQVTEHLQRPTTHAARSSSSRLTLMTLLTPTNIPLEARPLLPAFTKSLLDFNGFRCLHSSC